MSTLRHQVSRFRLIILALIIIIVGLVVFIAQRQGKTAALPDLATQTVQIRNVQKIITSDGKLAGIDTRTVYLPAGTTVQEVKSHVGDSVLAGQIIYVVQVGKVKTEVKSPIAGNVTELNYQVNDQVVNPSLVAATIVNSSSYKIKLAINETDALNIAAGQKAALTFTAIDLDKTYAAVVDSVGITPITGTTGVNYEVVIKPQELPATLKLGLSVEVAITTAQADNVLAIPDSYLIEKDKKFYLKVISWKDAEHTDYDATEQEVTVGLQTDEYVEIKTGVKEGDEILDPSFTVQRKFGFF